MILLAGCCSPQSTNDKRAQRTLPIDQQIMLTLQSWEGHDLSEAIKVWGAPVKSKFGGYEWHRETLHEGKPLTGVFYAACDEHNKIIAIGAQHPETFIYGLTYLGSPDFDLSIAIREEMRKRKNAAGGPPSPPGYKSPPRMFIDQQYRIFIDQQDSKPIPK